MKLQTIADILDVCVVTALVYSGLRWLRRRASRAVALCLLLVATLYVSAHVLDMYLTLSAFRIGLTVILLALIIVFQQDIRRGFEQLSTWGFADRSSASSGTIDTLLDAVSILAKEKIGVLRAVYFQPVICAGRPKLRFVDRGFGRSRFAVLAELRWKIWEHVKSPRSEVAQLHAEYLQHGRSHSAFPISAIPLARRFGDSSLKTPVPHCFSTGVAVKESCAEC